MIDMLKDKLCSIYSDTKEVLSLIYKPLVVLLALLVILYILV